MTVTDVACFSDYFLSIFPFPSVFFMLSMFRFLSLLKCASKDVTNIITLYYLSGS